MYGYLTPANPYIMDSKKSIGRLSCGRTGVPRLQIKFAVEVVSRKVCQPSLFMARTTRWSPLNTARGWLKNFLIITYRTISVLALGNSRCDYTLNGPSGQLTTYAVAYFANVS